MGGSRDSRDRSGHFPKRELEYGKPIASVRVQLRRKEKDASGVSARSRRSAAPSGRHIHQILYFFNSAIISDLYHYVSVTAQQCVHWLFLLIFLRLKSLLMKPCRIWPAEICQTTWWKHTHRLLGKGGLSKSRNKEFLVFILMAAL